MHLLGLASSSQIIRDVATATQVTATAIHELDLHNGILDHLRKTTLWRQLDARSTETIRRRFLNDLAVLDDGQNGEP